MTFVDVLTAYGREAKTRLNGPGEPEAALTTPVTHLVEQAGQTLGLTVVAHSQVAEQDGAVKPDFGIRVNGVLIGHLEVKAPGTSLDPSTYSRSSHNYRQWQRLKELPNLLHTNGTEFRHWSYGEPQGQPVSVHASSLLRAPDPLTAPDRLALVFQDFLRWTPTPITSVSRLVETLAPLARLLREEVQDALTEERRAKRAGADPATLPFLGIRADWRRLLFPQAKDEEFSDGFAQTVVFALLLALDDGIDLVNLSLHEVAQRLEVHHTLMGRTLNLLTEHVRDTAVSRAIEVISRVIGHTDWHRLNARTQNLYLHLYEDFLGTYDPARRRRSGSYYTPVPVVDAMTRLTDLALKQYMGKPKGLRDANVSIVDPAMGTGTFPLSIVRHVGDEAAALHGSGAKPEAMSSVVDRLYGIELQSGPFSVAELRLTAALRDAGAALPSNGLNLYVADTLEDPNVASDQNLPYTAQLIARQRQQANQMKRDRNVQVCIGNPPYKDHAGGMGGWIENGTDSNTGEPPLDAFRFPGNGVHERHLSNLYTYFWRWATWKVFESTNHPDVTDGGNGVICFITASGYLAGPGFKGMRNYLRRTCSQGWIINVTPEGMQSPNGVFAIETPVVIAIFVRQDDTDPNVPADIKYIDIAGTREEKFDALSKLTFAQDGWVDVRSDWTAPFTAAPETGWDDHPAADDVFPWRRNGIMAGRNWVYAPETGILEQRLRDLVNEDNPTEKATKFVEHLRAGRRDRGDGSLLRVKEPLPGSDTEQGTLVKFDDVTMVTDPKFVRVGFRAFDRQWLIADSRLINQPSPKLWAGRIPKQVFAVELHSEYPKAGPGLAYTALIPDVHYFRGSGGGRALPMLHPTGEPNIAPGLTAALSQSLGHTVTGEDVFAYVAGIAGHRGYVAEFDNDLRTPGVRIPITNDRALWERAVTLGRHTIWLHTYGQAGAHPDGHTDVLAALAPELRPQYAVPVGAAAPSDYRYIAAEQQLHVGPGRWDNVIPEVVAYTVGGTAVLDSWINFRKANPEKRHTSPLDSINASGWNSDWSVELSELLTVLTQLVAMEGTAEDLLAAVLEAPMLTKTTLAGLGTTWPSATRDHDPKMPLTGGLLGEAPE